MERPDQENLPQSAPRVFGRLSPFQPTAAVPVPEGSSLTQIAWEVIEHKPVSGDIVILVGDYPVPKEHWDYIRPKAGALVAVNVLPHGGDAFRSVALFAVAAGALAISGGAAAGFLGSSFAAGSFGANALALGVMTVGMIAINALIPLPETKFEGEESSPVLSITGSRNAARPFSPVPQVLGKWRYTPPYAAKPYTQIEGNDQFLTLLFTLGYGPLQIDEASARIGDTPLTSFSDYEIEINAGFSDDPGITLYQGTADPIPINTRVEYGWCPQCESPGPDPGSPNLYNRDVLDSDSAAVDVTLPNGLISINDNGDRNSRTVDIRVSFAEIGSPTFEADMTANEEEFVVGGITAKTSNTLRFSKTLTFPSLGDYTIRVFRNTFDDPEGTDADQDNTRFSATWWTGLTAFNSSENPISDAEDDCLTLIALRIKATDQLSGVIDQFSIVAQSIVLDYDGTPGSWTYRPSSNPASLFRHVLQGAACGRPVADHRIDITKLEAWHDWCSSATPEQYAFNMVRDFQASLWDTLRDVAGAAAAKPVNINGKWSVVYDDPALYETPVQMFTPRNSWGFRGSKSFPDHPHAYRVRFVDANNDYAQTEIVQYNVEAYSNTPYDKTTAEVFESIEFPGLVTEVLNRTMARYRLGTVKWRLSQFQFSADIEHIICTQGDPITVHYDSVDAANWGAARVKSLSGSDVTLDAIIDTAGLGTVGMTYRNATGNPVAAQVTPVGGDETNTFTHPGPLPSVGDLVAVGKYQLEMCYMVVDSIIPGQDQTATLRCYPAYYEVPP